MKGRTNVTFSFAIYLSKTTTNTSKNAFKKKLRKLRWIAAICFREKILFWSAKLFKACILYTIYITQALICFSWRITLLWKHIFWKFYQSSPPYFEHKYFQLKRKTCLKPWNVRRGFFRVNNLQKWKFQNNFDVGDVKIRASNIQTYFFFEK